MSRVDELLSFLIETGSTPVPAVVLARRLGVSTRTVRAYIKSINREYGAAVESSRAGYRLGADANHLRGRARSQRDGWFRNPSERAAYTLRLLATADEPLSIHDLAGRLYVSESTIETDLAKDRALLAELDLKIRRNHEFLSIEGQEPDRRRLMRRLLTDAAATRHQFIDLTELAALLGLPTLPQFKENMVRLLGREGLDVNEGAAEELVAHIAVMVDRVRTGHPIDVAVDPDEGPLSAATGEIAKLVTREFGVEVPVPELTYLGLLLVQKAIPTEALSVDESDFRLFVQDDYARLVADIVQMVNDNYLIDLGTDRFIGFLALHIRNLVERASNNRVARIPAGQSVKNTHPLVFEIAVFISHQLEKATGVEIAEDEIALIAFHVGARLQAMYDQDSRVGIAMVVPRYYDVHLALQSSIEEAVRGLGEVDEMHTSITPALEGTTADIVITTIPLEKDPGVPVVVIGSLPTADELRTVREAVLEIVESKRRIRVIGHLSRLFDPQLFLRVKGGEERDEILRKMARAMEDHGLVAPGFVVQVLERERLSPTSFLSGAAIPHSMQMDALQSGIAVCVADEPFDWAGQPVYLVAMIAVSESSKDIFGEVFDRFIHALVKPENVVGLKNLSNSYQEFIEGLLRIL
ncbi:PTS sugar transporter subunit IIA [Actinomycetaceae bacterium L2_0104]